MPRDLKIVVAAAPQPESKGDSKTESWWKTIPGMLTATAGFITAVAGLLAVLYQVGLFGGKATPSPQGSPTVTSQSLNGTTTPIAAAPNGTKYSVTFPSGTAVKFRNNRGQGTYEILAAQAERRSVGKLGLTFTIRMTNNGPADVGFYTDTFRLLVDDVPRAPVNRLADDVDARSAKESPIEFEMPDTAKSLALQVLVGEKQDDTANIAITLK
jgi:hypothetical protein